MQNLKLLNESSIRNQLQPAAMQLLSHLTILETVNSTNDYLLQKTDLPSGYVVLAEQQTAGRGRRGGRGWQSPLGTNIYLSLAWHFPTAARTTGLGLAVSVAVVDALQNYGLESIQIKWPNDILHQRHKLGGILIDANQTTDARCQVVIGIGINVAMPTESGQQIEQAWTDIQTIVGHTPDRNQLVSFLLNALLPALDDFQTRGFAAFKQRWQQLDALVGHEVNVHTAKGEQTGIAQGIDDSGFLIVEIDGVRHHLSSGEVSVRLRQKS